MKDTTFVYDESVRRVWIDNKQRIVSFHEVSGFRLLEFHSEDMYMKFLKQYEKQEYRYQ